MLHLSKNSLVRGKVQIRLLDGAITGHAVSSCCTYSHGPGTPHCEVIPTFTAHETD